MNGRQGLAQDEARARLVRDGPNEVAHERRRPLLLLARKFWGLSAWMLELITLLSLLLHKWADVGVAGGLLVVNAVLGFAQEARASAAVEALRQRLRVTARALRDGKWTSVPARELVVDDVIRLRAGDIVPADAQLVDGEISVDQSALTGESAEVRSAPGGVVPSGAVVRNGESSAIVVATGARTSFGKTTQLVKEAHPKLHIEEVVARVVRWLFLIVGVQVITALAVSLARGGNVLEMLPLALVLLMGAVPVALPVMFAVSTAVGAVALGKRGVLVARMSAAEDAATMDVVAADKTGTLTMNRVELIDAVPAQGFTGDEVVRLGALASNEANQDPIDLAFLRAAGERGLLGDTERIVRFVPFSAQTRRTEAFLASGVHVMKGALRAVAAAADVPEAEIASLEERVRGTRNGDARVLAVARARPGEEVTLCGVALLRDPPRPDSKRLIDELRGLGIDVKMLTGDALPVGQAIAHELGLGEVTAGSALRAVVDAGSAASAAALVGTVGGFAEVFPADKLAVVKALQGAGHVVGMTGDGVNDAPALRQAEVGIAVSGATDVAKAAASVVLTTEGLVGIIELVKGGRAIYQRILTWIINKLSRTILKTGFVVVAYLATGKLVISALGMVLLIFMTDFVKIALSTDNVRPSAKPETWKIGPLVIVAAGLGLLMLAEALASLAVATHVVGLGGGQLQTFTFQLLLFFALFSIVSIRERRWFWSSRPSRLLAFALIGDAVLGAVIGICGLADLAPLPWRVSALVFLFAAVSSLLVNDSVKVGLLARLTPAAGAPR